MNEAEVRKRGMCPKCKKLIQTKPHHLRRYVDRKGFCYFDGCEAEK